MILYLDILTSTRRIVTWFGFLSSPTEAQPDDVFTLAKWYLDLVTDEGTAIIGYVARLESGPVRVGYSSVLASVAGAAARESSAFGEADCPRHEEELVTWQHPTLDVRGRWQGLAPPIDGLYLFRRQQSIAHAFPQYQKQSRRL